MAIYLDHNAGAPLRPEVRAAMAAFAGSEGGNPASVHRSGQYARSLLEQAREQIAALVGAAPRQIVFTSGGTESNNLAIAGAAKAHPARRRIISSPIEHSSILAPLKELEDFGYEIVRVAPDRNGSIDSRAVLDALDDNTALVSLGLANAEVGTILDTAPLKGRVGANGSLLHLDAAQALGRIPVRVDELGCDLMTLSGHKIGAPAGIGALYVRDERALAPAIFGGPQERGLRAGTPNLLGAIAFGGAAQAVAEHLSEESARVASLAAAMLAQLTETIPGLRLNGPVSDCLSNTLNLTFPRVLGESLLIALDLEGVEVSMGSACAAGAVEPSHVLLAMGRSAAEARSSLRLSLGWSTTAEEIGRAAEIIARVWRRVASTELGSDVTVAAVGAS